MFGIDSPKPTTEVAADTAPHLVPADVLFRIAIPLPHTDIFEDYIEIFDANPRRVVRLLNSFRVHMKMLYLFTQSQHRSLSRKQTETQRKTQQRETQRETQRKTQQRETQRENQRETKMEGENGCLNCLNRSVVRKVIQWTILCELWPVRVAFLIHCASAFARFNSDFRFNSALTCTLREFAHLPIFAIENSGGSSRMSLHGVLALRPDSSVFAVKQGEAPVPDGLFAKVIYGMEHDKNGFERTVSKGSELTMMDIFDVVHADMDANVGLLSLTTNLYPAARTLVHTLLQYEIVHIVQPTLERQFDSREVSATQGHKISEERLSPHIDSGRSEKFESFPETQLSLRSFAAEQTSFRSQFSEVSTREELATHRVQVVREGHADRPDGIDKLGYDVYVKVLVDAILDRDPPKRIGLYAPWGTGKSFILQKIQLYLQCRSVVLNKIWNMIEQEDQVSKRGLTKDAIDSILTDPSKVADRVSLEEAYMQITKLYHAGSKELAKKAKREKHRSWWSRPRVRESHQRRCDVGADFYLLELSCFLAESLVLLLVLCHIFISSVCTNCITLSRGSRQVSAEEERPLNRNAEDCEEEYRPEEYDFWCVTFNAWKHERARSMEAAILATLAKAVEEHYGSIYADARFRGELWMYSVLLVIIGVGAYCAVLALEAFLPNEVSLESISILLTLALSLASALAVVWRICSPASSISEAIEKEHDRDADIEAQLGFSREIYTKLSELDDVLDNPSRMQTAWDILLPSILPYGLRVKLLQWVKTPKLKAFRPSRVVLFVDDLDRCSKSVALNTFRTCNAMVSEQSKSFLVCFAMDPRIIAESIVDDENYKWSGNGYQYLEKIINLPFTIPPIKQRDLSKLISETAVGIELKKQYLKDIRTFVQNPGSRFYNGIEFNLDLSGLKNYLTRDHVIAIASLLKKPNQNVKMLRLQDCGFGRDEIRIIGEALVANPDGPLETLELDDGRIELKETLYEEAVGQNALLYAYVLSRSTTRLRRLRISHGRVEEPEVKTLAQALQVNTTLLSLRLSGQIGDVGAQELAAAMTKNNSLQELWLEGNSIENLGAKALAEALESNHTLSVLRLGYNLIGDAGAQALGACIAKNKSLLALRLELNHIKSGAAAFGEALKSNETLTALYLGKNPIGNEAAQALGAGIARNQTLQQLGLEACCIYEAGASALAEGLKANQSLALLSLSGNRIGNSDAQALGASIAENKALQDLRLEWNAIKRAGAAAIGEALEVNETLTLLKLSFNQIGDAGARALATGLTKNTSLQTLRLETCEIKYSGAKAIAEALKANKTLTLLSLSANYLADAGAEALGSALEVNTTLLHLELQRNIIGNLGAEGLLKGLAENRTLRTLDLLHNFEINPDLRKQLDRHDFTESYFTSQEAEIDGRYKSTSFF